MIESWMPPDGLGYSSLRPVSLTSGGIALLVVAAMMLLGAVAAAIGLGTTGQTAGEGSPPAARTRCEYGCPNHASSGAAETRTSSTWCLNRFTIQEREYVGPQRGPAAHLARSQGRFRACPYAFFHRTRKRTTRPGGTILPCPTGYRT